LGRKRGCRPFKPSHHRTETNKPVGGTIDHGKRRMSDDKDQLCRKGRRDMEGEHSSIKNKDLQIKRSRCELIDKRGWQEIDSLTKKTLQLSPSPRGLNGVRVGWQEKRNASGNQPVERGRTRKATKNQVRGAKYITRGLAERSTSKIPTVREGSCVDQEGKA